MYWALCSSSFLHPHPVYAEPVGFRSVRPHLPRSAKALGANPIGLVLLVNSASLTAFLTPMATPAVPCAWPTAGYDLKALIKCSWSITLILPIIYILYTMTIFPCF